MLNEVAGYKMEAEEGTKLYCVNCAPEDKTGLEEIREADEIPLCDNCGQPMPAKPTEKGKEWILETFSSAEEAEKVYPFVGGWWYEVALEEKKAASTEPQPEIVEEEILTKMRQIDEILEKLLRG
jgi:NAD-dependent SIR2 family protein deacetylase